VARGDDRVLDVARIPEPADAANEELGIGFLDDAAADRGVAARDRRVELAERHAVSAETLGVHIHLPFAGHAPDGSDLRDARDGRQLVADVPVLDRAKLAEISAFAFDRVPEDLAERRRVRREIGHDAGRQRRSRGGETLEDARPCRVVVGLVPEDHANHRVVRLARRADGLDSREALQAHRERIRDLVLDLLRAAPHPVREDDHLVLGEIRDRVDGRPLERPDSRERRRRDEEEHEQAVPGAPLDDAVDHRRFSESTGGGLSGAVLAPK
jgi:hypothetical protein